MVFSSPLFLCIFFPLLIICYVLAPARLRNGVLLIASLLFYTWGEPEALPVLIGVVLINYFLALFIDKRCNADKKILFYIALFLNIACLVFFKYADFIVENVNYVINIADIPELPLPHIMLPIGISFYIFQAISYIVDVYRGDVKPQRSLWNFSLYISMFPQLIAGPIVRYITIFNDFSRRRLIVGHISEGLARFCIGLAKKIFLADNMGSIADCIFATPTEAIPCFWAWLGAIAYALQIYYDFSGYSDMAIGMGRMFNYHFPENFNFPYAACSLQDFWRRWHMSLTAWLKDYVYIPLGGSRCSFIVSSRNVLITLALCGIWHGASWTFLVWGVYNGLGLVLERGFKRYGHMTRCPGALSYALGRLYTLVFVLAGWVIFRSPDHIYAWNYLSVMFTGNPLCDFMTFNVNYLLFTTISNGIFLLLAIILSQPIRCLALNNLYQCRIGQIYIVLLFVVTYAFVITNQYSPFIYFRF